MLLPERADKEIECEVTRLELRTGVELRATEVPKSTWESESSSVVQVIVAELNPMFVAKTFEIRGAALSTVMEMKAMEVLLLESVALAATV